MAEIARLGAEPPGLDLKAACRAEMEAAGLSGAKASREIGLSPATISRWLNGTYTGDIPAVEASVSRWLETRREAVKHSLVGAGLDRHAETGAWKAIAAALAYAQADGGVTLVLGPSGRGKTWAAERYCATRSGAPFFRATRATGTMAGLLSRLSEAVGAGPVHGSAMEAETAIVKKLRDRGALVVIDEAHHLRAAQLDELRCIRDIAGCGLALIGDESIEMPLARCPQVIGRIGMRVEVRTLEEADVAAIVAGPLGRRPQKRELKPLLAVARGPGGLHALRGVLAAAFMIARDEGLDAITPEHLAAAIEDAA